MNKLLLEGLTDAAGFVVGGLLGFAARPAARIGPACADGYGGAPSRGIVLAGLGGGAGVQIARRLRAARRKDN